MSEDCLVLNVWTPRVVLRPAARDGVAARRRVQRRLRRRPRVRQRPLALRGDVVAVTINHRLNIFGYLHLGDRARQGYAASGNAGQLDIIAALGWVRKHRAVRRRPEQRDHLRPVGRRAEGREPARDAAGQGTVSQGDHPERRPAPLVPARYRKRIRRAGAARARVEAVAAGRAAGGAGRAPAGCRAGDRAGHRRVVGTPGRLPHAGVDAGRRRRDAAGSSLRPGGVAGECGRAAPHRDQQAGINLQHAGRQGDPVPRAHRSRVDGPGAPPRRHCGRARGEGTASCFPDFADRTLGADDTHRAFGYDTVAFEIVAAPWGKRRSMHISSRGSRRRTRPA